MTPKGLGPTKVGSPKVGSKVAHLDVGAAIAARSKGGQMRMEKMTGMYKAIAGGKTRAKAASASYGKLIGRPIISRPQPKGK